MFKSIIVSQLLNIYFINYIKPLNYFNTPDDETRSTISENIMFFKTSKS